MARKLTSADLVGRLRGAGYTLKQIGEILGRSDRMVSKVQAGKSDPPGYRDTLKRAWDNVNNRARHGRKRATPEQLKQAAPAPPRRQRPTGAEARLRHGVWKMERLWATGTIGGQAARSGATQLLPGVEIAHSRMWGLAVTISFRERQTPRPGGARKGAKWYPPKHVPEAPPKKIKVWLGELQITPRDLLQTVGDRDDHNLMLSILSHMRDEEIVDYDDDEAALADIERVEMRIWRL